MGFLLSLMWKSSPGKCTLSNPKNMKNRSISLLFLSLILLSVSCIDQESAPEFERGPGDVLLGVTGMHGRTARAGGWPESVREDVRQFDPGIGHLGTSNMKWPCEPGNPCPDPPETWKGDYFEFEHRLHVLREEIGIERIHFKVSSFYRPWSDDCAGLSYDDYMNHHAGAGRRYITDECFRAVFEDIFDRFGTDVFYSIALDNVPIYNFCGFEGSQGVRTWEEAFEVGDRWCDKMRGWVRILRGLDYKGLITAHDCGYRMFTHGPNGLLKDNPFDFFTFEWYGWHGTKNVPPRNWRERAYDWDAVRGGEFLEVEPEDRFQCWSDRAKLSPEELMQLFGTDVWFTEVNCNSTFLPSSFQDPINADPEKSYEWYKRNLEYAQSIGVKVWIPWMTVGGPLAIYDPLGVVKNPGLRLLMLEIEGRFTGTPE
jgi:hypothetical protein